MLTKALLVNAWSLQKVSISFCSQIIKEVQFVFASFTFNLTWQADRHNWVNCRDSFNIDPHHFQRSMLFPCSKGLYFSKVINDIVWLFFLAFSFFFPRKRCNHRHTKWLILIRNPRICILRSRFRISRYMSSRLDLDVASGGRTYEWISAEINFNQQQGNKPM